MLHNICTIVLSKLLDVRHDSECHPLLCPLLYMNAQHTVAHDASDLPAGNPESDLGEAITIVSDIVSS